MTSYKSLGLVNTVEMFKKAYAGHYGIGALNFNNLEQIQAILEAAVAEKSPVILQASKGAIAYASFPFLEGLGSMFEQFCQETGYAIPVALHLDHGPTIEVARQCIEHGFSSVMIDASSHDFEENVRLSKEVADMAHSQKDYVSVEAELGVLAGIEEDVQAEKSHYTNPDQVEEFVKRTGVDSLAVSIGTSHGAAKFTPEQCTRNADGLLVPPPLRFDILDEVEKRLPNYPIVLHGASSVPADAVRTINAFGGAMKDSVGIPEDQTREAVRRSACKVNIDSDGRLEFTAAIRKFMVENPSVFDPRKYLGAARAASKELYQKKFRDVLGSAGKA